MNTLIAMLVLIIGISIILGIFINLLKNSNKEEIPTLIFGISLFSIFLIILTSIVLIDYNTSKSPSPSFPEFSIVVFKQLSNGTPIPIDTLIIP